MKSIEGIISKIHIHKPVRITDDIERKRLRYQPKIQEKSTGYPSQHDGHYVYLLRICIKGGTTWWILSHTEIRNILLLKHGIRYRQSKVTLGDSLDPAEYHLKKRVEELRYKISYLLLTRFFSTKMRRGTNNRGKNIWRYLLVINTI
jgi:hypothetical protein